MSVRNRSDYGAGHPVRRCVVVADDCLGCWGTDLIAILRTRPPRQAARRPEFSVSLAVALMVALLGCVAAGSPAAAEACLSPRASDDADLVRAAAEIEAVPALCVSNKIVDENGVLWRFSVVRNVEQAGPLWVVPHDEEDAAFSAGIAAVRDHGGVMLALENREERMVAGRDPNRAFALSLEAATVCAVPPAPLYIAAHLEEWDRAFPIVGLHTNWDSHVEAGGQGTISILRPDDKMVPFPSASGIGRFADEDTIVMLPGETPPAENARLGKAIAWFNERGVHVLARVITPENNECTIADFLTLGDVAPYLNIEVEFGDVETETALVAIALDFFASEPGAAYAGSGAR